MVALRSRRLESLFGTSLDALHAEHVRGLVSSSAQEAFDLDFKAVLYGRGDSDRRALAGDVAALANTAGGVIVLGVAEDDQARAVAAPGVEITDAEVARIRQVIASQVAPMPVVDVLTVPSGTAECNDGTGPGETATGRPDDAASHRGFIVVAVPRSPAAPHAVLVNDALRYPKRNGATTRYLSEPEVAAAYRERVAGARRQTTRISDVEHEAVERLNPAGLPWVVTTLVPDLPGDLTLTSEIYEAFKAEITGKPATITSADIRFRRASVGPRRLLADGTMDNSPLAKWVSLDLHTDGSGAYGVCVLDLLERRRQQPVQEGEPQPQMIHEEALVIAVLSGLLHLARHARDRAAAGGSALIRAQVYPISPERSTELGHLHPQGFIDALGSRALTAQPPAAEAVAPLDDLAQPGPSLTQATALLANEIAHAFGIAELGHISRDGQIRRRYWAHTPIVTWAEQHGIAIA
jgi:hypothetical protein